MIDWIKRQWQSIKDEDARVEWLRENDWPLYCAIYGW